MYANTWFGMDFSRCLTYVAKRPRAPSTCLSVGLSWVHPDVALAAS
jgi:hypothetical protein